MAKPLKLGIVFILIAGLGVLCYLYSAARKKAVQDKCAQEFAIKYTSALHKNDFDGFLVLLHPKLYDYYKTNNSFDVARYGFFSMKPDSIDSKRINKADEISNPKAELMPAKESGLLDIIRVRFVTDGVESMRIKSAFGSFNIYVIFSEEDERYYLLLHPVTISELTHGFELSGKYYEGFDDISESNNYAGQERITGYDVNPEICKKHYVKSPKTNDECLKNMHDVLVREYPKVYKERIVKTWLNTAIVTIQMEREKGKALPIVMQFPRPYMKMTRESEDTWSIEYLDKIKVEPSPASPAAE